MNIVEAWNTVPEDDLLVLYSEAGSPVVEVTRRGSFIGAVRKLMELVPEKDILSDRWRWRV